VSVRLSVCFICLLHVAAAGLLLWAGGAGDIDPLLPGAQQQRRRITTCSSECGQCHAVSYRRKRNTDLLIVIEKLQCCNATQKVLDVVNYTEAACAQHTVDIVRRDHLYSKKRRK